MQNFLCVFISVSLIVKEEEEEEEVFGTCWFHM